MTRSPSTTWQPTFEYFSRYSDYLDCLEMLWTQVGASGLRSDDLLLPYQRTLLRDLKDGLDEHVLADMLEYWEYDLQRLTDRGRGWDKETPAKPRVDLELELTSKGISNASGVPQASIAGES